MFSAELVSSVELSHVIGNPHATRRDHHLSRYKNVLYLICVLYIDYHIAPCFDSTSLYHYFTSTKDSIHNLGDYYEDFVRGSTMQFWEASDAVSISKRDE